MSFPNYNVQNYITDQVLSLYLIWHDMTILLDVYTPDTKLNFVSSYEDEEYFSTGFCVTECTKHGK